MSERASQARSGFLTRTSGRLLQGAIIFGPLAFAGTRPGVWTTLCASLHVVFVIWLLALGVERRRPRIQGFMVAVTLLLIAYVWSRWLFIPLPPVESFTADHFNRVAARWPESVIWRTPLRVTELVSGLLAIFLVAVDLTASVRWRQRIVRTMAGTAVAAVALGFFQSGLGAPGIYWERPIVSMPSQFFGPFFHFTSAGAFINLSWPIPVTMAWYGWQRHQVTGHNATNAWAWGSVGFILLLAHTAHISRFPQVIAAFSLIIMIILLRPWRLIRWSGKAVAASLIAVSLMIVTAFVSIERTGQLHKIASRWEFLHLFPQTTLAEPLPAKADWPRLMRDDLVVTHSDANYFLQDRGASYAFAWKCFLLRPICGFGPAGWLAAIGEYNEDPTIGTFYQYLQFVHQDYLQTLVEWGLVGAGLAFLIVGRSLLNGISSARRIVREDGNSERTQAVTFGALVAIFTVLIQSLVDFPLQIPANALYACVLLALCCSSPWSEAKPAISSSNRYG